MKGVATALEHATGLFVAGEWVTGASTVSVRDKYTDEQIAELASPDDEQLEAALASAEAASRIEFPPSRRAQVLRVAAARLEAWGDDIVPMYVAETGFPAIEGERELARARSIFELSAQEAERLAGEVVPVQSTPGYDDTICLTLRVPVGVVAAISPFNAPLSTVAHKLGPALAAGNAVVLKPAEKTPISSMFIVAALIEAGLPAGRIQLVVGPGRTIGDRVVRDPRVRYVTFTGSTEVGRHIRSVSGLARTQLELGSNSPTIVWSDADLELASRLVAGAGYRKSGQVCTSVQRLIAHRSVADELVDRLASHVAKLGFGDPRAGSTTVGPLIDEGSADRARALIDDAVGHGARLVVGGASADATGVVLAPTLLAGVDRNARLSQQEAFAPIVGVTSVDSFEEAVSLANSTPYGLQAGVFCADLDIAFSFARSLEMGGVIINDTSSTHPDAMPYGGVKESGHGVEGPRYAVQDMTDSRAVMLRLRPRRG